MRVACALALALVTIAPARRARADATDVPALVKLIDDQGDLDRATWKEKRREAAKKLAQSKDRRAVPVLVKLAETETFDIVGEIAIEGLGALGDPAAIPTLQKIAGDNARDPGQRELARKALAKLGATADARPSGGDGSGSGTGSAGGTTGGGDGARVDKPLGGGTAGTAALPDAPSLPDDTLAAYERLTFAGGTANLLYDTVQKRTELNADITGTYQKRVDRQSLAWGANATAHVVTGVVGQSSVHSRLANVQVGGDGEVRLYGGQFYGVGRAAAALELDYLSATNAMNPNGDIKATQTFADLELAAGAGYGRVLDVGAAIRVRRLARTLDAARALGKPIDAATSRRLQLAWWALRGERSSYRALVTTVAILREVGILLSEPDAGLAYELLTVLRDTWLYVRPSGLDLQLAVSEGYLSRPADPMGTERGQIAQLLVRAGYGQQLADDKLEISGNGYARLRVVAPMGEPSPWALGATASVRRFTYGEHGDPFGLVDVTGVVALSTDDLMNSHKSLRIAGEVGFTYWLNQASGLRLAGQLVQDSGRVFLGASLAATYGLLDGTFAR